MTRLQEQKKNRLYHVENPSTLYFRFDDRFDSFLFVGCRCHKSSNVFDVSKSENKNYCPEKIDEQKNILM